jgi:hypothetical protein
MRERYPQPFSGGSVVWAATIIWAATAVRAATTIWAATLSASLADRNVTAPEGGVKANFGGCSAPNQIDCGVTLHGSGERRRFGFAERRAGGRELAQQFRRSPALTILLMPRRNLRMDVGHAYPIGPIHQTAAVARETEPMQPHYVDIAGTIRLAFFQDAARLVD